MSKTLSSLLAGAVVGVLLASQASAANRFYIDDLSLPVGPDSTGHTIPLLADMDQDTYAFSVNVEFDASKINVTAVDLGSDITGLDPEYAEGQISNSPGVITYGVVFDMSDPIDKKLSPGTGRELLVLTLDVLATEDDSVLLDFVDRPPSGGSDEPARLNVMTDVTAHSVAPDELGDGTLTFTNEKPIIDSFLNNSGNVGKDFIIVGRNFDVSGLRVLVCGVEADARVIGIGGQQISATAPACSPPISDGWAEVEICTDLGCVSEAQGFYYEGGPPPATFVRGNANDDGTVDLSDGVAILNDLFLGRPAPAPCRDALDSNDDGSVDVSDGIYLLNFLFLGGDDIPPPYPTAGVDPTGDSIPEC